MLNETLPNPSIGYHNSKKFQNDLFLLDEIQRLSQFGFALHWIKENSKAPVESGWSKSPCKSVADLYDSYKPGYGLGVVLGHKSQLTDGTYLANIDIDVKDPSALDEALDTLEDIYPGLYASGTPIIKTGYGQRLIVKVSAPYKGKLLYRSENKTVVYMPNNDSLKFDPNFLTQEQFDQGYRVRTSFEITFMCEGTQAILPPSIHPDTQKPYEWLSPIESVEFIELLGDDLVQSSISNYSNHKSNESINFSAAEYDLNLYTEKEIDTIRNGTNKDGSATLFGLLRRGVNLGYLKEQLLTIFSDPDNAMGEVAYRHARTSDRNRAVKWLYEQNLKKIYEDIGESSTEDDEESTIEQLRQLSINARRKEVHESSAPTGNADVISFDALRNLLKKNPKTRERKNKEPTVNIPGLEYTKSGKIKIDGSNLTKLIEPEVSKTVAQNLLTDRIIYIQKPAWSDAEIGDEAASELEILNLRRYVDIKYGGWFFERDVWSIILTSANLNAFDPVKQELESLPPWDGVPRIDTWLQENFGATKDPSHYVSDVFRKWLIGSIKRTYQQGCQFDWMLIFQGEQGCGKSTFARIIAGEQFYKSLKVNNLDQHYTNAVMIVKSARIVDFDELASIHRSSVESVKTFISATADDTRLPYARRESTHKRRCVFIGSTNQEKYLIDETGNRRFNPIVIGELNRQKLIEDRDQLWAEALHHYHNDNEFLDLEGESAEYAKFTRSSKMLQTDQDIMIELILDRFGSNSGNFNFDKFQIKDLFSPLNGGPFEGKFKLDHWKIINAGKALKKLNARKFTIRGLHYFELSCQMVEEYLKPKRWEILL